MLAVTPPDIDAYEQLSGAALDRLRAAVIAQGSIQAVATALGYSRPAISAALAGRYKGHTHKLRARIAEVLVDQVQCPHLGVALTPAACRDLSGRGMSTANREAIKQWQACQSCPHRKGDGDARQS